MNSLFVCEECKKTFDRKDHYELHINKKSNCRMVLSLIDEILNKKETDFLTKVNDKQTQNTTQNNNCVINIIFTNKDDILKDLLTTQSKKNNKRKKYSNRVRNLIGSRQKWCCANCSEMFGPVWHVDHVIRRQY